MKFPGVYDCDKPEADSPFFTMENLDFDTWLGRWQKKRTSAEYSMRKTLFEQNKQKVVRHNAEYRAGRQTWWMALNELADSTPEEFAMLRSHKYMPSNAPIVTYSNMTSNPPSFDWCLRFSWLFDWNI